MTIVTLCFPSQHGAGVAAFHFMFWGFSLSRLWISTKTETSHAARVNYMAAQQQRCALNYLPEFRAVATAPEELTVQIWSTDLRYLYFECFLFMPLSTSLYFRGTCCTFYFTTCIRQLLQIRIFAHDTEENVQTETIHRLINSQKIHWQL